MDYQSKNILWANIRELKELVTEIESAKLLDRPTPEVVSALTNQLESGLERLQKEYRNE